MKRLQDLAVTWVRRPDGHLSLRSRAALSRDGLLQCSTVKVGQIVAFDVSDLSSRDG